MDKIKIDLISVPFSGHLYPLLTLAEPLLHEENYQIRVITGDRKIELVEKIGFSALPILPDHPGKMEEIANTDMKISALGMLRQFRQVTQLLPEAMQELKKIWQADRPDIVIADFVTVVAGIVCEELGIPWITTIPTPFAIESRTSTPSYLGGLKPSQTVYGKIRDMAGRSLIHGFKRMAFALFRRNLGEYQNFKIYDEHGYERIYSPHSILALGMKELEFRDDFPAQLRWVGYRCRSFERVETELSITGQPGRKKVLVTCGTHLLWEKQNLMEMAKLLGRKYPDMDFWVSLGNCDARDRPVVFKAKNVRVYEYLPYEQILPEVDYVFHHGGAGILYHCIEYGKPALIMPRDYDQFDYAVRAEMAGIARICKKGDYLGMLKSFEELIRQKDWPELKALQARSHQYQSTKVLKNEIERLRPRPFR
ncbi:glycosyltransferase [Clostridiales bacterium COT073_COT-073]|nr:glycosyltransferase [Clostridiales bacterium COT073_COT-073]